MKKQHLLVASAMFSLSLTSCGGNPNAPKIDLENKVITYGLYPQSRVTNENGLLSQLRDLTPEAIDEDTGWYLYEGAYYAKVSAKPLYGNSTDAVFENGDKIVEFDSYWFKCEPIIWRILAEKDDGYLAFSEYVLESHVFNSNTWNDYSQSSIRTYLNMEFFNIAFSKDEGEYVLETLVDNSAATTASPSTHEDFDNTLDKVFLLSYQDLINEEYGFSSENGPDKNGKDTGRGTSVTDYARAVGASFASNGYGTYWTRSPESSRYVYDGGVTMEGKTCYSSGNVRPAITIKK